MFAYLAPSAARRIWLRPAALPPVMLVLIATAIAQTAPVSSEKLNQPAVTLAPFQVDGSNDSRYRAASTLAGSRLNSSLKDVASVIDVYTQDFMRDLGAVSLDQVLAYANNLENDTEDTIHGLANLNISTNNSFRYRIRGLPASRARNYFEFDYPVDTFNADRLDESRGPNSILFGFGSPGGIVNSSTKQALLKRRIAEVEVMTGTEIDRRFALDVNIPLIDEKLAVRVNAVTQREAGWRDFTYDNLDAFHIAVKSEPRPGTVLTAEYERFINDDAVARPLTFWSQAETWDAAGKQLINTNFAGRANATLNPGLNSSPLAQLSGSNYWVFTEQNNNLLNWRGMTRSNRASYTNEAGQRFTAFADLRSMVLQPDGILEVNTMGPGAGRNLDLDNAFVTWQQKVTKNLYFEVAGSWQYSDWRSRRMPASTLFADPNAFLPAGGAASTGPASVATTNPFRGQYYFETVAQYWRTTAEGKYMRASASYDFERPGMFGKHRIGALLQRDEYETRTRALQEMVLLNGAPISNLAANAANNLTRRFYVTDPSDPKAYRNADVNNPGVPLDITLSDGTRLTTRLYQYTSAPADYTKENEVMMGVLQSRWWNERVHTIVGIRKDDVKFDDWGSYVSDGGGAYVRSEANRSIVPYSGITRNYGVVYHAFEHLSFFANRSSSYGVPGLKVIYAPKGQFMEPTKGDGRDFGVKFSLPKFRLEGSLSYYEATSENETDNQNVEGWGVNGSNSILDALVAANLMNATAAAPLRSTGTGDTVDSEGNGVEFNISGSITSNWDVRLNYSYTERSLSNAFPRVNAWAADTLRPFWATLDRDNPNTSAADNILDTVFSGANSIRTLIQNFESNLATRGQARTIVTGLRPHKANIFTTYAFRAGAVKGLRVGGGVRHDAANYAGADSSGKVLRGRGFTNVDLMAAYTRTIWKRPTTLQLNVRDAFRNDPAVSPSVINASGNWDTIIISPPRSITLSLRVAL